MIQNVIFDVGMVLVDFSWQRVMKELGFSEEVFEAVADATVRSPLWNEYDRSRMSDEEILCGFIANAPSQEAHIRLYWEHVGDTIRCYPYTHDWIRELKEKGLHCYILSNYARRTLFFEFPDPVVRIGITPDRILDMLPIQADIRLLERI